MLLLAKSWRHCNNGLLSLIETSNVAEIPGPALIPLPQLCSTSDTMLKVLSHLVKLQCISNCASYSAVSRVDWDCWYCQLLRCSRFVSARKSCPCAYTVMVQIFVSFVLKCKCVCKVQDDLERGL